MSEIIFILIALAVCIFAFLTVLSRNVFHSAVWLAMTLLSISGIYFYLGAEFLGVIQILIYVGGIVTLFVFAIKLTANIEDATIKQTNQQVIFAGILSVALFLIFLKVIGFYPWQAGLLSGESISLKQLGQLLMTTYVVPFEFISLILLAAMVGAIVIGKIKK